MSKTNGQRQTIKVCISIPNEGHPPCEAYTNRLENFFSLGRFSEASKHPNATGPIFEFFIITLGRIFTPLAREEAADATLELGADYLFMIDDDMTCQSDLFQRLYAHDVDIVAPLAFTRNFPHHPVLYDVDEGWDPVSQQDYFVNHYIDSYPKDTLVEADAVGFGAVLIKRKVIESIKKPRFMCTSGTGEDILFCHKARKAGFRVFMDTAIKLGHLSHPIEVTEAYREKVRAELKYEDSIPLVAKRRSIQPGEGLLILGD